MRMWELKKSRIRFLAWGWTVKIEGREVGGMETVSSIAVTVPDFARMIKDIIMREKLTAGGSDEHTLENQKVSASCTPSRMLARSTDI